MEFNNKKLERTSKVVNYLISFILCGFLISLSSSLLDDVGDWKDRPTAQEFENKELLKQHDKELDKLDAQLQNKQQRKASIRNTIQIADSNYKNAKQSFDNWLAARKTVGSPREDKEVLSRANKLDAYYKTEQDWRRELSLVEDSINTIQHSVAAINDDINEERNRSQEERIKAMRKYDLKVFLMRLLFIFPILLLGIYFMMKFRNHRYWPIFLGFVLFSFYAFFFGLLPYLPSYGGYIRNTVGVILSILLGIYAINKIREFVARKKSELKAPTTERAKNVQLETAEKALDNHMCPSCGKDFLQYRFAGAKKKSELQSTITNFCRFCGLELFKKCKNCQCENFAHLPYCSNCGDELAEKKA